MNIKSLLNKKFIAAVVTVIVLAAIAFDLGPVREYACKAVDLFGLDPIDACAAE